jgi:hypothetical protein
MTGQFEIGMRLNINDECLGTIIDMTDDCILIESPICRGWAPKADILATMEGPPTEVQYLRTQPQFLSSAL